jgi:predicted Zn-dependent protease
MMAVATLAAGVSGAAAQNDDRAAALVGLARLKRDGGDPAAARRHFEEARALGPLPLPALVEYFWLIARDDLAAALPVGREIVQVAPGHDDVRDRTITAAISVQREADVLELAEGGRRARPAMALWPRRLAESYLRQGRPSDAVAAYRAAVGLEEAETGDRVGLAVALEAADQPAEAAVVWASVPKEVWSSRADWSTSRLRALAKGGAASDAAPELEAWLQAHPDDREIRALFVELLVQTGRPDLAAAAIGPLAAGPSGTAWTRREIDLAVTAGQHARAIARLERLVAGRRTVSSDHWRLADLLLTVKRHNDARAVVNQLATPAVGCNDRLFGLIERLPEPAGTDLLLELVPRQRCGESSAWARRAIERAVATERHTEALAALQSWPETSSLRRDLAPLEGQLLFWTGQPAQAIPLLTAALDVRPLDHRVRATLVDAYRALKQPREAWKTAEPLLALPSLRAEGLMTLAATALEAGEPADTRAILARIPDNAVPAADRAGLLGRALAAEGRFEEAERTLLAVDAGALTPEARQALADSSLAARIARARTLRTNGQPAEALAILDDLALTGEAAFLRAELTLAVKGAAAGAAALGAVAREPGSGAHVWLAWTSAVSTPAERAAILARARERFPDNPDILRLLGRTQLTLGDAGSARATAAATLALAPRDEDAWFVLVDATAATAPRPALDDVFDAFGARVADSPALVVRMAERAAGLAAAPDDPLLARALGWLDAIDAGEALAAARQLARARVQSAARQWTPALASIDQALAHQPDLPEALRLRADILAWTGRHAQALTAYDRYLAASPGDAAARRQQARVAGWAGRFDEARRLYAALVRDLPELRAVAAEVQAKDARFDERWDAAVTAGQRWLTLEPDSVEAAFDYAEALRATGHGRDADARLRLLSLSGHQLAQTALDRAAFNRRPSFVLTDLRHDASGFGGLRLLDLAEQGGRFDVLVGDALRLAGGGAALQAETADGRRTGSRALMNAAIRLAPNVSLNAAVAWWQIGAAPGTGAGTLEAVWSPADYWTITAGVDRERMLENLATVDGGLTATGPFASTSRRTPASSLALRAGWQRLSDGNERQRVSLTATRAIGLRALQAVLWMEHLAYRRAPTAYFSPAGFTRADAGLEYTLRVAAPRFAHDRRREITLGYLIGADDRRERYQHPSLRLAFEIVRGLAIDLSAGAIRSDVYRDESFSVSLRVGGGASRQ